MSIFDDLIPKDLYHSYIIEADPNDEVLESLRSFLRNRGDVDLNSPDIISQIYSTFTISDSYEIKQWHNEKQVTDKKKIFILGAKFINHDAERTLLKILEEPGQNTHFFIIIPNSLLLLDTIRSRTHIIKLYSDSKNKNALDFLDLNVKNRMDFIAKIIKDSSSEKDSGLVRHTATLLVNELEVIFHDKFKKDKMNKNLTFIIEELAKARDYLNLPGASVKMILEHIALVI